jgi:anaerobic magnesium-protoporphyrin IX monomethyl ester cyclase
MAPLGLLSMAAWLEQTAPPGGSTTAWPGTGSAPMRPLSGTSWIGSRTWWVFRPRPPAFWMATTWPRRSNSSNPSQNRFRRCSMSPPSARLCWKAFPAIDFLCMGEGEVTLAELAGWRPTGHITGLIWRDNGHIVTNPRRPLLPDLDQLPFPAYEKLWGFPKRYHLPLFSYIQPPGPPWSPAGDAPTSAPTATARCSSRATATIQPPISMPICVICATGSVSAT